MREDASEGWRYVSNGATMNIDPWGLSVGDTQGTGGVNPVGDVYGIDLSQMDHYGDTIGRTYPHCLYQLECDF